MNEKDTYINNLQSFTDKFADKMISYSPNLIGAIILLFVGIWVCRLIRKFTRKRIVRP